MLQIVPVIRYIRVPNECPATVAVTVANVPHMHITMRTIRNFAIASGLSLSIFLNSSLFFVSSFFLLTISLYRFRSLSLSLYSLSPLSIYPSSLSYRSPFFLYASPFFLLSLTPFTLSLCPLPFFSVSVVGACGCNTCTTILYILYTTFVLVNKTTKITSHYAVV